MGYTEQNFEEHIEQTLSQTGWHKALHSEYDRQLCQLPEKLLDFIKTSQPRQYKKLKDQYGKDTDRKLCKRIDMEIGSRGLIDVLRKHVKDRGCTFRLLYFEPKSGLNPDHARLYGFNKFHVVRQLRFAPDNEKSIDMVYFINGIPILTMELKNQLTGQRIADAEKQYKEDRDPKEPLLQFKRCIAHFCVDNDRASMCTRLMRDKTKFLPYNKGIDNPIHESGHKTTYIWEEVLQKESLLDILENFVFIDTKKEKEWDAKQRKVVDKKKVIQVFPRYHQLVVIRQLRKALKEGGIGDNYLIQHTTGAGKSYEIGWLSHMLTSLYRSKEDDKRMFDSIIVVTDRRVLDKQLQNTIRQLEQTGGVVNPVNKTSQQLKEFLEKGKDIIITTIQKFPVISKTIADLPGKSFAVVVDEVHSSQSGESSRHLKKSLAGGIEIEVDEEELYNDLDSRVISEMKKTGVQDHISFFGFTGTPKNKTLEIFGRKDEEGKFAPFHSYTMKQSIAEQFTLDVLENYTTFKRYFKLNKKVEEDKELPKSQVTRTLINFVDKHDRTIEEKVRITLDHFRTNTVNKIKGKARAMLVTSSRYHCVLYFKEMKKQMQELGLSYKCLVAFSGKIKHGGLESTEHSLNQLPPKVDIPDALKDPAYRILIVANKYQTGFDEPMLHTMFVDKKLSGLQAVQTLSRLNRSATGKTDTFVLDFKNDPEDILKAFQPYYQTTYLKGETDPNRLYTLQTDIEGFHVYSDHDLEDFCVVFYDKTKAQEQLQPPLNRAVDKWKALEEEDQQEEFRSLIQSYIRLYGYISQITTFHDVELEKLYVFLRFLNKKLPKRPVERITGITDAIDLDSLRIQKNYEGSIQLNSEDGKVYPIDLGNPGGVEEPELDLLSRIIKDLNDAFGGIFTEEDKTDFKQVQSRIHSNEDLEKVMTGDNTESNKKKKFDEVMMQIVLSYVNDRFDFYKKMENPKVKDFITSMLYKDYKQRLSGR